ncbi:MAG: DUF3311 domain-containing protein [Bryobacterales bacterium]|nr:DUF3311 domain-containing protein [Bryobacterales bacterium]
MPAKRPLLRSVIVGLIPFTAMCFSVPLWDRAEPTFFGLPFNLAWLLGWMVLTPVCMSVAYRIEAARDREERAPK